ncbi:type IV pilus modification protein PilV [Zestomonas carbonaria]|nr:type IV pilus modification protein PilV [Pseudomonas carbonaria]
MKTRRSTQGFTLIEVLVALVILAVGLLGMATLMMSSLQSSQSAYLRSQASVLAYDIVERMRANHTQAVTTDDYELNVDTEATSDPGCASSGCSASQQAQLDLFQWRTALANGIPGATASIVRDNQNEYQVTISWSEVGTQLENQDGTEVNPSFSLRIDL